MVGCGVSYEFAGISLILMASRKAITYQDAGVSIDEADRAVSLIRKHARGTFTRSVLTDIGSFGGGYLLSGWKNPVLVSSADGVGTKVKIAFQTGRHNTIGEDLVNHCVNDIAVQGAVPLFFLDYFAVGKLDAEVAGQVVEGVARGCGANGCARSLLLRLRHGWHSQNGAYPVRQFFVLARHDFFE